MKPYKVQILQEEEEGELYWNDFYLDLDAINGFYVVRYAEMIEHELVKLIVVYVEGENYTLKPEKHLEEYLLKRFVNCAVEDVRNN